MSSWVFLLDLDRAPGAPRGTCRRNTDDRPVGPSSVATRSAGEAGG